MRLCSTQIIQVPFPFPNVYLGASTRFHDAKPLLPNPFFSFKLQVPRDLLQTPQARLNIPSTLFLPSRLPIVILCGS